MPLTKLAKPMPNTSETISEPIEAQASKALRQRSSGILARYSNEMPRRISPTSTRNSGRYRPLNRVAYQPGKAAKVAPPAVISQTSLPSQVGPIVLIITRRSLGSLPRMGYSIETPKSKPSRKKKPIHSTAMSRNHTICSGDASRLACSGIREFVSMSMSPASVREGQWGVVGRLLHLHQRGESFLDRLDEQLQHDDRHDRVHQRVQDHRQPHGAGTVAR